MDWEPQPHGLRWLGGTQHCFLVKQHMPCGSLKVTTHVQTQDTQYGVTLGLFLLSSLPSLELKSGHWAIPQPLSVFFHPWGRCAFHSFWYSLGLVSPSSGLCSDLWKYFKIFERVVQRLNHHLMFWNECTIETKVVVHSYNPRTGEVDSGGSGVQTHCFLGCNFEASTNRTVTKTNGFPPACFQVPARAGKFLFL